MIISGSLRCRILNLNNFLLRSSLDIFVPLQSFKKTFFTPKKQHQKAICEKLKYYLLKVELLLMLLWAIRRKKNREKDKKNSTNSTHNWEINIKLHLTGKFHFNSQSLQFFTPRRLQNPSTKDAIHCKSPTMMIFDFGWG